MEPETDASTRRVYGALAQDDEALVQVNGAVRVLREDLEDVRPAIGEAPVGEAPVPGDCRRAGGEVAARQAADADAARRPARGRHAGGVGEPEARDHRLARARTELDGLRRDPDEAERVVQPERALDRRLASLLVGGRDDPAPTAERVIGELALLRRVRPRVGVHARLPRERLRERGRAPGAEQA